MDQPRGAIGGLPDRPGSLNQLKRLGDAIRDDDAAAYGSLHYNEVWSWSNDLVAAGVQDVGDLDLGSVLDAPGTVSITGRAKIRSTVREKLQRRRSDRLPSIQDLAGVRVEADMTLTEQDRVVEAIRRRFGQGVDAVHDLRDGSHSGYRAVHLWVRLDSPRGAWFEVQVRTQLQGGWANMYEALADVYGRGIRYGEPPEPHDTQDIIDQAHQISRGVFKSLEDLQRLWEERIRLGRKVDEREISRLLVQIAGNEAQAEELARTAIAGDGLEIDNFVQSGRSLGSWALTALTESVRLLSQEKGA